ncbi:MAG: class F sortase [Actinocatenispora sp.]
MSSPGGASRQARVRRALDSLTERWWVLAIVLAVIVVIAAGSVVAVGLGQDHDQTHTADRVAASPSSTSSGPAMARSAPVSLEIPAINVRVPVSRLGLNPDHTVEVPTDFQRAGWYRLGPTPGQVGSAVILGHVDSYRGPAAFFRLRSLRAGDRVDVTLADHEVVHFMVNRVATFSKKHFPSRLVYASHGYRALQLVTCGGKFDTEARSYESNVVAFTSMVGAASMPGQNVPGSHG